MQHNNTDRPFVSAIIPTSHRGDRIIPAIESILASDYPAFEIIIVDQSRDDATAEAMRVFANDDRVRYVRSGTVGVSNARTIALKVAQGEFAVLTDDDCIVPPHWMAQLAELLTHNPQVGVIFTDLVATEYDQTQGHIPVHVVSSERLLKSIREWRRTGEQTIGLSATMAVRRIPALQIGGFDSELGSGSRFRSGGELDFALRMLLAGWHVLRVKEPSVVHYGFRTWPQSSRLFRNYSCGPAASFIKLARCGNPAFIAYWAQDAWHEIFLPSLRLLAHGKRPRPLGRVPLLFNGFFAGMWAPIDFVQKRYVPTHDPYDYEEIVFIQSSAQPLRRAAVYDGA